MYVYKSTHEIESDGNLDTGYNQRSQVMWTNRIIHITTGSIDQINPLFDGNNVPLPLFASDELDVKEHNMPEAPTRDSEMANETKHMISVGRTEVDDGDRRVSEKRERRMILVSRRILISMWKSERFSFE